MKTKTLAFLLLLLTIRAYSQTIVLTDKTPVRTKPDYKSEISFTAQKGDSFILTGKENDYWKVKGKDKERYIFHTYIGNYSFLDSLTKVFESKNDSLKLALAKRNDSLKLVLAKLKVKRYEDSLKEESKNKLAMNALMLKMYGRKYGSLINKHSVCIGMSKEMVRWSLGEPSKINRTVTARKISEQWIYSRYASKDYYYYFDNGILTAWQD